MALFDFPRWKLTSPAAESGVVAPDERLSAGQTLVMGVQHAVAMFGATVLMPLLMGLDPNLSILMSGVGTAVLCRHRRTGAELSRLQRRFCRGGDRHYRL